MVKINELQIENVKRIKAVQITPSADGLTVIGGKNNQGKTSVLDSIAWALGGDRYRPTSAAREGSVVPPHIKLTLSNGLVVERKGKNSSLTVTDPEGKRSGQQLLDEFVSQFAIDLPRFMDANDREKANILLRIIGGGEQLAQYETQETQLYNQRHAIGQIADQKAKFAKEMPYYEGVPQEPISASNLIKEQQDILARNGENQRKRDHLSEITHTKHRLFDELQRLEERISMLQQQKNELQQQWSDAVAQEEIARKTVAQLIDESTAELEQSIRDIEEINRKVRANLDREKADEDAAQYKRQYENLTGQIETVRQNKLDLLNGADMPLSGLSVDNGRLLYNGFAWDNMSGSDQLKVATAIVRKLNPQCGFVLLDKLEQMDTDTLTTFAEWLEENGLQAIATRVSTGGECSIIIEDGYASTPDNPAPKNWKAGEF